MTRLANRTARLREIEELLLMTPDGLSAVEISQRLDVNRRTIYRDLEFLEEEGVPLWQEDGRYGINRTSYLANVRLTFHEAMSLVMAGLLLSRTVDAQNPHVISVLRKLAGILPASLLTHLERAIDRVRAYSGGQREVAVLEALAESWGTGRKVKVGYRSPRSGALRPRIIAPYAIEPTPSGFYVICHDDWSDELRTFKLDRLESAAVLKERYTIPESFDLEAHLATGWRIMAGDEQNEVVLRFSSVIASRVNERQWHPSQVIEPLAEGGCVLRVWVAQPLEMQPWIRSWGAEVEVLSPAWLRQQIADELRQAVAHYQEPVTV
ncbi:MAG: transcriptional regulator [Anaerolineales bacterium]|nr:transcriptional regulator [Anaerolineales bacterium]MCB8967754.1 transcriptional regulator [Ardenticatenaceae bacterium]